MKTRPKKNQRGDRLRQPLAVPVQNPPLAAVAGRLGGSRWVFWLCMLGVIALAGFFRVYRLGDAAFRADTVLFWRVCHAPISAGWILTHWFELIGGGFVGPYALAYIKGFIDLFHCPVTDFWIRFPVALLTTVAVPWCFLSGREFGGRKFGWIVACMLAVNAYHIQLSREAYYYFLLIPGAVLLPAGLLRLWRLRRLGGDMPWRLMAAPAVALFFLLYAYFTGWFFAAPALLFIGSVCLWRLWRRLCTWREPLRWAVCCGILFLPLAFLPWGFPAIFGTVDDLAHLRTETVRMGFGTGDPLSKVLVSFLTTEGFGRRGFAIVVNGLALLGCATILVTGRRVRSRLLLMIGIIAGGGLVLMAGHKAQGTPPDIRYMVAGQVALVVMLCAGLWYGPRLLLRRVSKRAGRWLGWALVIAAFGWNLYPAFLSTGILGVPKPYKAITRYMDTAFPPRTLVLVDRWFEPWNELAMYPSTNAVYTFTVPSEPVDTALALGWRDTVVRFFDRFPDAVYLSVSASYVTDPRWGPWDWPQTNFAHCVKIRDEASIELGRLGMVYRDEGGDFGRIIPLYFNTREDLLARARRDGRRMIWFHGPEWGYTKLWQQMKNDFRDWRIMERRATLEVHNLTETPVSAILRMRGFVGARQGTKTVIVGRESSLTFRAGTLSEAASKPIVLPPGQSTLVLTDAAGEGMAVSPLLVDSIELR